MNPLAQEEYEAEKERLTGELATQRADLERSLEELEQLRQELTDTVKQRPLRGRPLPPSSATSPRSPGPSSREVKGGYG